MFTMVFPQAGFIKLETVNHKLCGWNDISTMPQLYNTTLSENN
jgi:hypothetical protein